MFSIAGRIEGGWILGIGIHFARAEMCHNLAWKNYRDRSTRLLKLLETRKISRPTFIRGTRKRARPSDARVATWLSIFFTFQCTDDIITPYACDKLLRNSIYHARDIARTPPSGVVCSDLRRWEKGLVLLEVRKKRLGSEVNHCICRGKGSLRSGGSPHCA